MKGFTGGSALSSPFYYPDSGIDDNNWWRILAVGKASARKDARLVAPTSPAVAMDAEAGAQGATAEALNDGRSSDFRAVGDGTQLR